MSNMLAGKVALVTGAASGIGAATVKSIVRHGGRAVAFDRSPGVRELECLGDVLPIIGDATRLDDLNDAVRLGTETYGRLTAAVAVAAITRAGTVDSMDPYVWEEVIRVNLGSVFLLAKTALPSLRAAGGGSFVVVASQHGLVGCPQNVAYCAAKAGAINFTRAMALDHAAEGVRANAVCPGPVDTPMTREAFRQTGGSYESVTSKVPLGRIGQPPDIAETISFLLSDLSAYVTGAAWTIDGGYTAQ